MGRAFRIYKPMQQTTLKNLKKTGLLTKRMKKLTTEQILGQTILQHQNIVQSMDFLIMAEEHFWKRQGRKSIFLESADVAERLYSATYHAKWVDGIELPFSSFLFSMPKDFHVNGVIIPGCLVTWIPFKDFAPAAIKPLCESAGIEPPGKVSVPDEYKDSPTIHLSYQDPYDASRFTYARVVVARDMFGPLLNAKDPEEFRALAGDFSNSSFKGIIQSEPNDLVIQFTLLKLVIAAAVYNQATEGEHLKTGLPSGQVQVEGQVRELRPNHATLSMPKVRGKERATPEDHYRSFHFRQFRAERYYQGRYANWPRGSRWTFISDAWVSPSGEDIEAYTQTAPDV